MSIARAGRVALVSGATTGIGTASALALAEAGATVALRGSDRASPAYVAAKHGVLGLTRQAALEYADRGIRVNAARADRVGGGVSGE